MRTSAAAALLVLVAFAKVRAETSDTAQEEHAHEGSFGSGAVYDMGAGTNSFIVTPAEGTFEDATFAFMVVPTISADMDGLEEAEHEAEGAWEGFLESTAEPTVLASGDLATPSVDVVYQISLEDPLAVVPFDISTAGAYAVFVEHGELPTALVSPDGEILVAGYVEEPAGEEEEEEEEEINATGTKWMSALAASVIVSLCSLVGIIVVIHRNVADGIDLSHAFTFASGALITASLLHLIPEALEGLESKYHELHDLGLYAGLSVMGGMSIGIVIHALLGSDHSTYGPTVAIIKDEKAAVAGTVQSSTDVTQPPSPTKSNAESLHDLIKTRDGRALCDIRGLRPVCWNVIIGDLVHNFADGVAIGAAFLTCSSTIGWTVTATIVIHELPHELADFMALINGGMSLKQAFAYNFLSALTSVLGVMVIMGLESELSEFDISVVLLVGSGCFIFIALSELLPDALAISTSGSVMKSQVLKLGSFLFGGLLIGIPLLVDEHCSAGGDGHDH